MSALTATRADSELLRLIGKRVRDARLWAGLTQQDLATRICMTRPSIANLERGDQDMPITRLALIARILGINLSDLVAGGAL